MAQYWLSSCELGKMIIGLSDMMAPPEKRSNNYSLHMLKSPIKMNVSKAMQDTDIEHRKAYYLSDLSLEDVIKVNFVNILTYYS